MAAVIACRIDFSLQCRKVHRPARGGEFTAHVQAHSDCQSRRNRLPDHQDRPPHGDRDRRGLFRGRQGRPACRDGRYRHRHRPARGGQELPADRQDFGGLQGVGRRGRASRLRLPVRARGLPQGAGSRRRRLHRAEPQGHRRHGRQDRVQEGGGRGTRLHRARPSRRDRRRGRGDGDRRGDRLSGDDQGFRRRRRQGHAHCLFQSRGGGRLRALEVGGEVLVRRRPHVHREIHHRSAPHRDPGAGRQARQRHLSRRARMLDPAPQPESDRGGAVPLLDAATRKKMGEQAVALAKAVGYDLRRHRRIRRRSGQELLLPRNEHAAAGRASGDRTDHRHRSGRADDPQRGRRKTIAEAKRREAQRLGGRNPRLCRRPVPQVPALDRPPDALPAAGRAQRQRRHLAQRHRSLRGRRDFDLLRSDDRQAGHPRGHARRGDRRAGRRARCLRHRRHPPQYSVSRRR